MLICCSAIRWLFQKIPDVMLLLYYSGIIFKYICNIMEFFSLHCSCTYLESNKSTKCSAYCCCNDGLLLRLIPLYFHGSFSGHIYLCLGAIFCIYLWTMTSKCKVKFIHCCRSDRRVHPSKYCTAACCLHCNAWNSLTLHVVTYKTVHPFWLLIKE